MTAWHRFVRRQRVKRKRTLRRSLRSAMRTNSNLSAQSTKSALSKWHSECVTEHAEQHRRVMRWLFAWKMKCQPTKSLKARMSATQSIHKRAQRRVLRLAYQKWSERVQATCVLRNALQISAQRTAVSAWLCRLFHDK